MRACWAEPYLNPASQHLFGRAARRILEDARDRLGELLGANTSSAKPDRVIFTSGGTEANNLAIRGIRADGDWSRKAAKSQSHVIVSSIEHPSVAAFADEIEQIASQLRFTRYGLAASRLAVDTNGLVSLLDLARCISPKTRIAAVMFANNETGVIQSIADFAAICNQHKVPLHVDACQAAGKVAIDFHGLGAGSMSVAAHKFGGPLGIGALIVREGIQPRAQLRGGFQQAGTRPGTESVTLAVGMRSALDCWNDHRSEWTERLRTLRDRFEAEIRVGYPATVIIGEKAQRLPQVSNIAFVGLDRQQLFLALDQAGVACSTGSACASGSSEPSPVHVAMGLPPEVISSALRFSFGVQTTPEEAAEAARRIIAVCNGFRREK